MKLSPVYGGLAIAVLAATAFFRFAPQSDAAINDDGASSRNAIALNKFVIRHIAETGVFFQAAMDMNGDGELSGELADVYAVSLSEGAAGVRAEHEEEALAPDTFVDRGIIANLSRESVTLFFVLGEGQKKIVLQPLQAVLIGEPTDLLLGSHAWGCVCICCPETGNCQSITISCEDLLPGYTGSGECNCNHANGKRCVFYDADGRVVRGTTSVCESAFVPVVTP